MIDNNPISMGYNGPPSGEPHCHGEGCPLSNEGRCTRAVHAEKNAIDRAKEFFEHEEVCVNWRNLFRYSTMYVTVSPCDHCTEYLIAHGVKRVFYRYPYRKSAALDKYQANFQMEVFHILPNGSILKHGTKRIVSV